CFGQKRQPNCAESDVKGAEHEDVHEIPPGELVMVPPPPPTLTVSVADEAGVVVVVVVVSGGAVVVVDSIGRVVVVVSGGAVVVDSAGTVVVVESGVGAGATQAATAMSPSARNSNPVIKRARVNACIRNSPSPLQQEYATGCGVGQRRGALSHPWCSLPLAR
ncbi:MAG: hypothetical protein ACKOYM_06085, partial [Actinomycetes bacterium]